MLAANALLAFLDRDAAPNERHAGAMLLATALDDLHLVRTIFLKYPGE